MKASIIISSYNRLPLFKRTLWAIINRPPSIPFEVIVVDDGSTEAVLDEVRSYSSKINWKFILFDSKEFEQKTGLKKFHNNPCVTNNIGFRFSTGDLIFQQGNEVIAWNNVYDQLIKDIPDSENFLVMSTTYDVSKQILSSLDNYGTNLTNKEIENCYQWPLQSIYYRSDVTNYISLANRGLWEKLEGYDERYYAGISAEDSDFVRRARKLPNFKQVISEGISLHQNHDGRTCYYKQSPKVMTDDRWDDGAAINRVVYDSWDETFKNPQKWPWGSYGVKEVLSNIK